MRNNNKPKGTIIILTLLFMNIIFGSFLMLSSSTQANPESQPATSELIADAGGAKSLASAPEVKPVSEVAHSIPASPRSESLKLLLLGSFLLLIATGIQMLSSRKNKPKSRPA